MLKKNIAFLAVFLFCVAIFTSACGGGGKSEVPTDNSSLYYFLAQQQNNNQEEEKVNILKVSKSLVSILVGGEDSLTVTLNDEDITNQVTFTVDDETVARVENGTVTGIGAGITTVEVFYEGAESVTFVVNVTDSVLPNLEVEPSEISVGVGVEGTVEVTLEGDKVTETVTYKVDDESIAKVDKGTVKGLRVGSANITVSLAGANSAVFTVKVISNPFAGAEKGDFRNMGTYPQTADCEVLPIEWQVLDVDSDNNRVLVVSRYGLDVIPFNPYNNGNYGNVWANSQIRIWLNNYFYNIAFTDVEKGFIASVSIVNNVLSFENGDTNVFLLSRADMLKADYGFSTSIGSDPTRQCISTEYAKALGCDTCTSNGVENCCYWWLRSAYPSNSSSVYCVYYDGSVGDRYATYTYFAVRPAIWIKL